MGEVVTGAAGDRIPFPAPVSLVGTGGRRLAVTVCDVGLACCGMEVGAALTRGLQELVAGGTGRQPEPGGPVPPGRTGRPPLHVLVVAGTLTDKLAPDVLRFWRGMPQPCRVISFGACASTGGPYWDSYAVTKGVDQLLPVDVYVPGCPPRPEALADAIRVLEDG